MEKGKDTLNAVMFAYNWNYQYELMVYFLFFVRVFFCFFFFPFVLVFYNRETDIHVWMCTYKHIYAYSPYTPEYYTDLFTSSAGGPRSDTPVTLSTPSTPDF